MIGFIVFIGIHATCNLPCLMFLLSLFGRYVTLFGRYVTLFRRYVMLSFLPDASHFPLSRSLSVDPSRFAGFPPILNQLETPKLTTLSLLLDTIC